MKVKLNITDVSSEDEAVLAVKIYHYINNAMEHPEWIIKNKVKNMDYEEEMRWICKEEEE